MTNNFFPPFQEEEESLDKEIHVCSQEFNLFH